MKNKTLRILSLGLAVTTALSASTPVFAYDVDEHDNSIESAQYQSTEDENFSSVTNVFAQLGSEYKVTIPKTVVLSGASKDARYYVKVAGDIAGYEKINVVPEDSFKLSAKNKADETATVNQDKTVWTVHDFDTDANGLVEASSITAGKWQGTFNFNINLESDDISTLPEEKVLGDLIVPDVNEWKGQTLQDIYVMKVGDTGILEATNDGEDVSGALEITSSNEDVIKVENKQLKAVNAGQTTITTVYEDKSFSAKIKVVKPETPAHVHAAGEAVKENEIAATCVQNGSYDEVIYCLDCGEELSRITKTVPKLGHVPGETIKTVIKEPTCTEKGTHTETTYCSRCGEIISERTVSDYELGHEIVNDKCIRCGLISGFYGTKDGEKVFISWSDLVNKYGLDIEKDNAVDSWDSWTNASTWTLQYIYGKYNLVGELIIDDSVKTLGKYNVGVIDGLTGLTIGANTDLSKVGSLRTLKNLEYVNISPNNPYYVSIEGVIFTKDMKTLVLYPATKSETNYIIPEGVTIIKDKAFVWNTYLVSVTIPDSVTDIGQGAFSRCTSLKSITIPSSVSNIKNQTFDTCTSLAEIIMPDSVTNISYGAFWKNYSLKSIIIPDSVTSIGDNAFNGCTSLTLVTMSDSVTSIGEHAFAFNPIEKVLYENTTYNSWSEFYDTNKDKINIKQGRILN